MDFNTVTIINNEIEVWSKKHYSYMRIKASSEELEVIASKKRGWKTLVRKVYTEALNENRDSILY